MAGGDHLYTWIAYDNAKLGITIVAVRQLVSRGMCGVELALLG